MNKIRITVFIFIILLLTSIVWAAPIPDTGQKKCYDADGKEIDCPSVGQPFYGQNGNYIINPMSYTKLDANGNELPDSATFWSMVKDNVTGLIWEMKTNKDGIINYNDPHDADNTYVYLNDGKTANDIQYFIKVLNDAKYGGYSDWRLPTIQELGNIINYGIPSPGPTVSLEYFPDTVSSFYWSSSIFALSEGAAHWGANFYYGYNSNNNWGYSGYVRAVRGGDNSSFKDNLNGTVTDNSTGLMWQQSAPSAMTWEESLAYCESLKLGGYSDWRLPTLKELRSIVDYSLGYWVWGVSINTTLFPNTASSFYWSSTTTAYDTISAWGINFGYGEDNYGGKNGSGYVRAVRGDKTRMLGDLVISPLGRIVSCGAGSTTFSVVNTGTRTAPWEAAVVSGAGWLSISSGNSGDGSGTITCNFSGNASYVNRTGIVRITAGADHLDVTVEQEPAITPCTATMDANLSLHIPLLSYLIPPWTGTPAYHVDLVYDDNAMFPNQIIFALTDVGSVQRSDFSCSASSFLLDPSSWSVVNELTIEIGDMKFIGDATRYWVDLEYSPLYSTDSKICFIVIGYGVD